MKREILFGKFAIPVIITACYAVIFLQDRYPAISWMTDVLHVLSPMLAAWWLWRAYRREKGELSLFWLSLMAGMMLYGIAQIIYSYHFLRTGVQPDFPSISDVFWVGQNTIFLAALCYLVHKQRNPYRMARFLLETLIVMSVCATISWEILIQPIIASTDYAANSLFLTIYIAYPVADLGILFGVLLAYFTSILHFSRKVFSMMATGMLMMIVADSVYLFNTLTNEYQWGGLIDPLWPLSFLLIGLASLYASEQDKQRSRQVRVWTAEEAEKRDWLRTLVPYVALVLLFMAVLVVQEPSSGLIVGSMITVFFVVLRQFFTLLENRKLLRRLMEAIKEKQFLADHDELTGLPNRRQFNLRLKEGVQLAQKNQQQLAVLFVDLDNFKLINDSLGHSAGDHALKEVVKQLLSTIPPGHVLTRWGGDEFVIILHAVTRESAEAIANDLLESISKPIELGGHDLYLTASIGISLYPDDGNEQEALVKHADAALYDAKANGKNTCCFYSAKGSGPLIKRIELEAQLYRALENREFTLYYQPRLDLREQKLVGAEALIRWPHPQHGMIPPNQFIPVAEENGLIIPISEWVIRTTCEQVRVWEKAGFPPLVTSINLSARHFYQKNLISFIARTLQETGVRPESIEFEITESMAMDVQRTTETLEQMRQLGVKVSLDDFGKGFSSLNYLRKFPISHLKIDQSFVQEIAANAKDAAVVKTIIEMAHNLQLSVIAEGVETEEQLEWLISHDCDEAQGYLISHPLPAPELTAIFHKMNHSVDPPIEKSSPAS